MNDHANPAVTKEELAYFQQLVNELHVECAHLIKTNESLREENEELRRENERLHEQLENAAHSEDSFSADERQMLKQQLRMLIKRIDHHLKETG
ncbi:MAG: hypothetical protein ACOC2C_00495 [Cyclonatronaceae bacterium]